MRWQISLFFASILLCSVVVISAALLQATILFSSSGEIQKSAYLASTASYVINTDGTNYWVERYDGEILYPSTNGTYVINSCIENANAGEKIFIRNGTYLCHDIILKNKTFLEGESRKGTILKLDKDNAYILKSHSDPLTASAWIQDVTIRDLQLWGDKDWRTNAKSGIYGWFGYSNFEHLYVWGFHDNNINLTRPDGQYSYSLRFFDIHSSVSDASGFYSYGVTDSHLVMSEIEGTVGTAVHIEDSAAWHIVDNYIGHTKADGSHGLYLDSKGSMVVGNQIDWCYEDHLHLKDSWLCNIGENRFLIEQTGDTTRSVIELETSHRNTIIGNHFDGVGATKAYAVKENGSPGNTYSNIVIGNVADDPAITTAFTKFVGNSSERDNSWQPYGLISKPVRRYTTWVTTDGTESIANDTEYTNSGCPKAIYMQDADTFDVYVNGELIFDDVKQAQIYIVAADKFKIVWTSTLTTLKVFGH